MRVLVVSPHMDDEVLGCGGTIVRHVQNGDEVYICFVASRIYNHTFDKAKAQKEESHALKAKKKLGYKKAIFLRLHDERLDHCIQDILIPLEKKISKYKPDLLYIPFRGDNHQDHRAVFEALRAVIRPFATPFLKRVLMFEVPSSTDQSPPLPENAFLPNHYVNIESTIQTKLEAFRCYSSERRPFPHPRSLEGITALARKRGMEIGFPFAEGFVIIRNKWDGYLY